MRRWPEIEKDTDDEDAGDGRIIRLSCLSLSITTGKDRKKKTFKYQQVPLWINVEIYASCHSRTPRHHHPKLRGYAVWRTLYALSRTHARRDTHYVTLELNPCFLVFNYVKRITTLNSCISTQFYINNILTKILCIYVMTDPILHLFTSPVSQHIKTFGS